MPTLSAPAADRTAPSAEALIAEARRRRRRRWLAGLVVLALAAAGVAVWTSRLGTGHPASVAPAPRPGSAALMSCSAPHYGALPVWARSGFSPATQAMPQVLGANRDIVAVLWARQDPLQSPPAPGRNNKILWVSRLPDRTGSNLEISARRLVGGREVGPVVRRIVPGGPGPSGIDMPQAGCWQFALRWSGVQDMVALDYAGHSG
jgi:hypothetical protein